MEVQLDEKISLYIYFLEENPGVAKASNQTSRAGSKHTSLKNVNRRFALNVYCSYEYNWKDKNPITEKEKKEREKENRFIQLLYENENEFRLCSWSYCQANNWNVNFLGIEGEFWLWRWLFLLFQDQMLLILLVFANVEIFRLFSALSSFTCNLFTSCRYLDSQLNKLFADPRAS